jgi:hypothetical protein
MIYFLSLCYILYGVWRRLSLDMSEVMRFGEPELWQEPEEEITYYVYADSEPIMEIIL